MAIANNKNFNNRGRNFRKPEEQHRINERILAKEVRVIADDLEPEVFPIAKALEMAQERELDLVEISPNAVPPVCKIIFGPNTDDHDFNFKLNHARKFIEEGAKIKAFVFFKGRTIIFKERGEILLLKLAQELEDVATVESMPKMEGKRMLMFLAPKKKK